MKNMKFVKRILVLFTLVLSSICSIAQNIEPTETVKNFFEKYEQEGSDKALDYLFSTNYWMEEHSKDDISSIKVSLQRHIDLIGNYYGYDYITAKSIGQNFKLYSYLIKYDLQPIRFVFIFYKPNDQWLIYHFTYDQEFVEELTEAAKVY